MNKIDNVKTITFPDPFSLATWIKTNVLNPMRQKQLMYEGVQYHYVNKTHYEIQVELSEQERTLLDIGHMSLKDNCDLSVRAINALHAANIQTVRDLTKSSRKKLLMYRNIGLKTYKEIKQVLDELQLTFME